jgi:ribose transport system permease protein
MSGLAIQARRGRANALLRGLASDRAGLVFAILVLCAIISQQTPYFLNETNFSNIGVAISYIGIMTVGFTLVMIAGGIDLSVGAVAALAGQVFAYTLNGGTPMIVSVILALGAGVLCGLFNSFLMVTIGINAIVGTIATQFLFRGIAYTFGGVGAASTSIADDTISKLANGKWLGIPVPAWLMIAVFAIVGMAWSFTRFGANLAAVGGNKVAARRAGIRVGITLSLAYVISATCAALAGVLLVGLNGGSVPSNAMGIELTVLAGVIIGGTSLVGGVGSLFGALLGVLGLGILTNGLNLLGVSAFMKPVAIGIALLLAITIDSLRQRRRAFRDER